MNSAEATTFPTYRSLKESNLKPIGSREVLVSAVRDLIEQVDGEILIDGSTFEVCFSREQLVRLEAEHGIVPVLYSDTNPMGGYAKDLVQSNSPYFESEQRGEYDHCVVVLKKHFRDQIGLVTYPAQPMSKNDIEGAGFENVPTTAQVIAVCTKNEEGAFEWTDSQVYPDGDHVQAPLTNAEQYGQSCFEGLVVMVNEEGYVSVFRPEKNAQRLQTSCKALSIPPISESQVVESIKACVLANKDYLPNPGSNAKMYVRPYIKGLKGGYGVGPANAYAFAIEVFPFGGYGASREDVWNLVGAEDKRRSFQGGNGADKVAGNYAPTMGTKVEKKEAGYADVFYLGDKLEVQNINGENVRVAKEVLDEATAANMFFISDENETKVLHTPPLDRKAILPGITRMSVIEMARFLGYEVREEELTFDDILKMKGAFLTGSAAGMIRVGSMTYKGKQIELDHLSEQDGDDTTELFFTLYDTLYKARKGELGNNYEKMKGWAQIIGKV